MSVRVARRPRRIEIVSLKPAVSGQPVVEPKVLRFIVPIITCALLAGIAADQAAREVAPAGVDEYHARVRAALDKIPYNIGDWIGKDTEIRQEALKILDANCTLSRVYRNYKTQHTATLLLVQCADARSLLGHYPPVCYPSQGWSEISSEPGSVPKSYGAFSTTRYAFAYDLMQQSNTLHVTHFTVLPDGRIAPDMGLLETAARDRRYTFCGGASVQLIVDSGLSENEQEEAYDMLFQAAAPWIEVVRAGLDS